MALDRDALRDMARTALARKSLQAFAARLDPTYEQTRHTRAICDHLDALERRDIDRLMLFLPPRHGKTWHASERFPAYCLGRRPDRQMIIASYTIDRARASSRKARALFSEPAWPFREVQLASDSQAVDEWRTSAGGVLKAAGVGGSMTGFGAHGLIIDDPVKDRAEADSLGRRNAIWDWYRDVARTRLMRGGTQLIAATRWHEDDLAGRILASGAASSWTVLRLPAIAEDNDPLGRAPGEVLWPGGMADVPSVAAGEISSRSFAALYQGAPAATEGELFKRVWMTRRYRELPEITHAVMWIDGAWKVGVANDRSAIAIWGTDGIDRYLIHAWAGRLEYPDLRAKVTDVYARFSELLGVRLHVFAEDAASGTPLVQELRRSTHIPIVGIPAVGPKFSRAEAVTPAFESGKVLLPLDAPWLDDWIEEHAGFPGMKHDDFVDTTSGALGFLDRRLGKSRAMVFATANADAPVVPQEKKRGLILGSVRT